MRRVLCGLLLLACKSVPAPRQPVVALRTPPHGPAPLETISLAGAAWSKTVLAQGQLYLLRASGVVTAGARRLDAEWAFAPDGSEATDAIGATDVGIDVGFKQVLPAIG